MKKLAVSAVLALSSVSAFAVSAQPGIFVGGFGGWSINDAPNASSVSALSNQSVSSENRNITLGVNAGYYYAVGDNILVGPEIGYVSFGRNYYKYPDGQRYSFGSHGIEGLISATYLMQSGTNAFVKVGAINDRQSGNFAGGAYDIKKWLPTAAVGVGYMPVQNFNIALQYQRVFGDTNTNAVTYTHEKPVAQNAFTLGLTYTFPI